jgi:hypothetical protein
MAGVRISNRSVIRGRVVDGDFRGPTVAKDCHRAIRASDCWRQFRQTNQHCRRCWRCRARPAGNRRRDSSTTIPRLSYTQPRWNSGATASGLTSAVNLPFPTGRHLTRLHSRLRCRDNHGPCCGSDGPPLCPKRSKSGATNWLSRRFKILTNRFGPGEITC